MSMYARMICICMYGVCVCVCVYDMHAWPQWSRPVRAQHLTLSVEYLWYVRVYACMHVCVYIYDIYAWPQ